MTPHQRKVADVIAASRLMSVAELEAAAADPTMPIWAAATYQLEIDNRPALATIETQDGLGVWRVWGHGRTEGQLRRMERDARKQYVHVRRVPLGVA